MYFKHFSSFQSVLALCRRAFFTVPYALLRFSIFPNFSAFRSELQNHRTPDTMGATPKAAPALDFYVPSNGVKQR